MLCSQVMERNGLWMQNATFRENAMFYVATVNFNASYTIVLHKIDSLKVSNNHLKDSETGGLHCVYRQKDNCIQTGSLLEA